MTTRTPRDVAIIVPFLNAQDTLAEAIDSIVGQTVFERVHAILVDNDSTDDSPAIAARYAAAHSNIQVVHRIGGGCGGARNAGLPHVREPYVTFLDADDLLKSESVERRLELAISADADVVLGAMETFPVVRPYTPVDIYAHDRIVDGVAEDRRLVHTANVSAILFRRDFFDDPANHFLEDMPFEDVSVTTAALVQAKRIAVSSYVGYRYRKDPAASTIMSTAHSRPGNYRDHLTINTLVHDRHRHDPIATEAVGHMVIRTIQMYLLKAPATLDDAQLRSFFERARDLYRRYPLGQIAQYAPDIPLALAFYSVLADDFELFCEPQRHLVGFDLVDGVPCLRLDRPPIPHLSPLLRVQTDDPLRYGTGILSATLASAQTGPDGLLELRGLIAHRGTAAVHVPLTGFGLSLKIGDTGLSTPIALSRSAPGEPWSWSSQLDSHQIPAGRHRLSFTADPWSPRRSYPIVSPGPFDPAPHLRIRQSRSRQRTNLTITRPS